MTNLDAMKYIFFRKKAKKERDNYMKELKQKLKKEVTHE